MILIVDHDGKVLPADTVIFEGINVRSQPWGRTIIGGASATAMKERTCTRVIPLTVTRIISYTATREPIVTLTNWRTLTRLQPVTVTEWYTMSRARYVGTATVTVEKSTRKYVTRPVTCQTQAQPATRWEYATSDKEETITRELTCHSKVVTKPVTCQSKPVTAERTVTECIVTNTITREVTA